MSRLVASAQPPSDSTMVTILWLLLSLVLPGLGFHIRVSCPQDKECQLALLSQSDALLECRISTAHWSFSGLNKHGNPVTLSSLNNVGEDEDGGLLIQDPSPFNTGLYRCHDENGTRVASYRIDFQDVTRLHATHINLGQQPLKNETLNLGLRETVYTQWEPWQECSNCERLSERKRLGYCYIKEPLEDPVPCGLYLGETKTIYLRVRPEMQVELCYVLCEGYLTGGDYVIFDNFRFTSESAWLTCPSASIYRPVHWEADNTTLTWQGQLSGEASSTSMDLYSGGRKLKVFQPATYRCFVEQELIAQFNPTAYVDLLEAETQPEAQWQGLSRAQLGKAQPVLKRLKLVLLIVIVSLLAVGGLLCKVVFSPLRGKKKNQVLLVK